MFLFVCLFVFNFPSTARSFRDGHPHLLSLAKDVKLDKYTVPTGNRTPGCHVAVHYATAATRKLHHVSVKWYGRMGCPVTAWYGRMGCSVTAWYGRMGCPVTAWYGRMGCPVTAWYGRMGCPVTAWYDWMGCPVTAWYGRMGCSVTAWYGQMGCPVTAWYD